MAINSVGNSPPLLFSLLNREHARSAEQLPVNLKQKSDETQTEDRPGLRQELSREEQQQVKELAARDREVKTHEAAHKAAGGSLTGPARFSYTTGPDGKRYATGGEVSIDTSAVPGDPQATLIKANRIRAAAVAPVEPSGQDRRVAAQASQMAADARMEITKQKREGNADNKAAAESYRISRQLLYDNSGSISGSSKTGNVLDEMI